jgi:hypothetical protein
MRNLPPIRYTDDPPWDEEPRNVLVCEKCERRDAGLAGAEVLPDDAEFDGYCDRHGKHNEFHTIEG